MNPRLKTLAMLICLVIFTNQLHADTNVLIIGSTRSFSEGGENGVFHEAPFNPTVVATHLQGILSQDAAITGPVNVVLEDIYKTKFQTVRYDGNTVYDFTSHCYSLAQHYLWPEGKAARLANLRGEGARVWDYIVLCNDPYITANLPGMVAEGLKLIREEVAKSANPAQVLLLAQWPESTSRFTATQFNEIAHRVGNSAGLTVVPAGKSWSSYGPKDTSTSHPTPRGEYLAAASIYSKIFNRSAKTSAYDFPTVGDAIADHALSEIQASAGVAQYTGTYTSFNPFQMKYLTKRVVSYRETGSSTEDRLAAALNHLDDVHRIAFNTTGYAGVPSTRWDFNYGRGNDWWEDDKDYEVDPNKFDWVYGFPMHHYNTTAPTTMPYGIDKHYYIVTGYAPYYEDGTDLGIPYNMIRPGTREPDWPEAVRAIPIRLMWQKMADKSPGFNPLADTAHMHDNLNDAAAAFMYTLLSGRCPIVAEPTPQGSANPAWMQWLGHKIGYETAWQMSHLTTRAPGFRVLPSATGATTLTPTATETMTVNFANPPQSNVTVNVSVSNANAAGLSTQTLTFTPANYNVPQQVLVTGLAGGLASEAFNVVFTTVSADEVYNQVSDSWGYTINRSIISTVSFDANGGTAASPASKSVTSGTAYGTLATTSRAGFTFNGWFTAASGGTVVTSATAVTASANHTLFAQWREVYTVTFDANGGTAASPASKSVTAGSTYGTLATTGRVGFIFNGWFTATSGGTLVTTATTVTASANHTLYAQWTLAPTYTVSYLGNGNSGGTVPSNQTKTQGVNLVLATNTGNLSKTGFVFSGWNTAADGSGTAYAAGATYTGNAALTLHARWNVSPVVNAGSDQAVTLGASAPWSPTALAPQLWLDGSTATNNAGTISIANAGSGGGTVSGPAALAAGGIGTLQAVQFSGGTKYLTGDYINTGTTLSAFFVGKSLNTSQTAWAGMMSVWANGQTSDFNNVGSSVLFNQNSATVNSVQTFRNTALSSTTGTLTAGFLAGTVFDGVKNTAYLNGSAAVAVASSGNFNAGKVVLGARWQTSVFNFSWNGNLGEAIICNASLSAPDRQKVEGYLAHKWGLAGSLAAGHPHKAAPPVGAVVAASLDGTATDTDVLTYAWSVVSGPASV
ncbi:MAG: InlB B-repeat-containing protein, partial [Luteolibacter sp.]